MHQPGLTRLGDDAVENRLELVRPQPGAKATQASVVGGDLFRLQADKLLAGQVQIDLVFHLTIRQVIQELQKYHFE